MCIIISLFIFAAITGYLNSVSNIYSQDFKWEIQEAKRNIDNYKWKTKGYLKTPWGIKYET